MAGAILTINAGSSSLKSSVFAIASDGALRLDCKVVIEGVGAEPRFTARDATGAVVDQASWADAETPFETLLGAVLDWVERRTGGALAAVGHRVVHGGADHVRPERVSDALLVDLDRLVPLAPLHEPHNLAAIRAVGDVRPDLPQVACFDTAFHATLPPVARRFALPREFEAAGVRRYGFHGLSYEFIASRLAELDPALGAGRVIVAHLGSGASLCALRGGRSVETTMGFTALDGLVMGTRCGTLDAGVVLHLQRERGLSLAEVESVLNKRSGLLGVSGVSADMRVLLASEDPRAAEAVELFVYRAAREIGALTACLGGLDGLVFTAGIGERAPAIRDGICARLAWLGVELDPAANAADAPVISAPASRVCVRRIVTDEEAMIARHTFATITA